MKYWYYLTDSFCGVAATNEKFFPIAKICRTYNIKEPQFKNIIEISKQDYDYLSELMD